MTSKPTDPLLNVREVSAFIASSVPTVWRRAADGTLPKPLKIGGMTRWLQSEIEACIAEAKANRDAA